MSKLHIFLLRSPSISVKRNGVAMLLERRLSELTLGAWLAAGTSKSRLSGLLFPSSDPDQAKTNLRVLLYRFKKETGFSLLEASSRTIVLNSDIIFDVDDYLKRIEEGSQTGISDLTDILTTVENSINEITERSELYVRFKRKLETIKSDCKLHVVEKISGGTVKYEAVVLNRLVQKNYDDEELVVCVAEQALFGGHINLAIKALDAHARHVRSKLGLPVSSRVNEIIKLAFDKIKCTPRQVSPSQVVEEYFCDCAFEIADLLKSGRDIVLYGPKNTGINFLLANIKQALSIEEYAEIKFDCNIAMKSQLAIESRKRISIIQLLETDLDDIKLSEFLHNENRPRVLLYYYKSYGIQATPTVSMKKCLNDLFLFINVASVGDEACRKWLHETQASVSYDEARYLGLVWPAVLQQNIPVLDSGIRFSPSWVAIKQSIEIELSGEASENLIFLWLLYRIKLIDATGATSKLIFARHLMMSGSSIFDSGLVLASGRISLMGEEVLKGVSPSRFNKTDWHYISAIFYCDNIRFQDLKITTQVCEEFINMVFVQGFLANVLDWHLYRNRSAKVEQLKDSVFNSISKTELQIVDCKLLVLLNFIFAESGNRYNSSALIGLNSRMFALPISNSQKFRLGMSLAWLAYRSRNDFFAASILRAIDFNKLKRIERISFISLYTLVSKRHSSAKFAESLVRRLLSCDSEFNTDWVSFKPNCFLILSFLCGEYGRSDLAMQLLKRYRQKLIQLSMGRELSRCDNYIIFASSGCGQLVKARPSIDYLTQIFLSSIDDFSLRQNSLRVVFRSLAMLNEWRVLDEYISHPDEWVHLADPVAKFVAHLCEYNISLTSGDRLSIEHRIKENLLELLGACRALSSDRAALVCFSVCLTLVINVLPSFPWLTELFGAAEAFMHAANLNSEEWVLISLCKKYSNSAAAVHQLELISRYYKGRYIVQVVFPALHRFVSIYSIHLATVCKIFQIDEAEYIKIHAVWSEPDACSLYCSSPFMEHAESSNGGCDWPTLHLAGC